MNIDKIDINKNILLSNNNPNNLRETFGEIVNDYPAVDDHRKVIENRLNLNNSDINLNR